MVAAKQEGAAGHTVVAAAQQILPMAASSLLPRRILFHPPFKSSSSSSSAPSSSLTPLNDPSPSIDPLADARARSVQSSSAAPDSRPTTEELCSTSLESTPLQRIGAGLSNLGNTCFLNSVLQCLTYTPPLGAYLRSGTHKSTCRLAGFCAMCALESHVKQALSSTGRTVSPTHLVKNLRCISRSFQMYRQEDAHEYMRYLIEALQKCSSNEISSGISLVCQKSLIQNIFGGRLRSQVKCTQCSHCSNTYDPFLDLSLEIVRAESLLKALSRFTAVEVLDGDNKYQCSRCKIKVKALKQFTIDKAPHVLTIQFKRFSSSGGFGGKIDKKVHFDQTLDLKPFANAEKDEELKYSLYGVLVHSGWSTHSGHYFCFVRTAMDMWHILDDSRVSQVSEKTVLEQKAYILFYVRDTSNTTKSNEVAGPPPSANNRAVDSDIMKTEVHSATLTDEVPSPSPNAKKNKVVHNDLLLNGQAQSSPRILDSSGGCAINNSKMSVSSSLDGDGAGVNKNVECIRSVANKNVESSCVRNDYERPLQQVLDRDDCDNQPLSGNCRNGQSSACENSQQAEDTKRDQQTFDASSPALRSAFLEVAVARWSEEEGFKRGEDKIHNLPNEVEASCGYVLDDWDEEYDRGKRKKVRNKMGGDEVTRDSEGPIYPNKRRKIKQKISKQATLASHDQKHSQGSNLFQEAVATKSKRVNARLKKYKKRSRALGYKKMFFKRPFLKHI